MQSFIDKFSAVLQLIRNEFSDCHLIIHSDFNLYLFKCSTSRYCSEFVSLMYCNNLFPTILRPTRTREASATLIEWVADASPVHLDETLRWDVHIKSIIRKISKFVPILYSIRSYLDRTPFKLLYNCLIYPFVLTVLNPLIVFPKKIIRLI